MFLHRIAAIAAVTLALGGAIAVAAPRSSFSPLIAQQPTEQPRMQGRWLQDLNLSPEQTEKIQAIRNRYKDPLSQERQAVQQAQQELRRLMVGNASADQVRQQYKQVETLRSQLMATRFNSLLEIRDVLTPEQRQKFADRLEKRGGVLRERLRDRSEKQLRNRDQNQLPLSAMDGNFAVMNAFND